LAGKTLNSVPWLKIPRTCHGKLIPINLQFVGYWADSVVIHYCWNTPKFV